MKKPSHRMDIILRGQVTPSSQAPPPKKNMAMLLLYNKKNLRRKKKPTPVNSSKKQEKTEEKNIYKAETKDKRQISSSKNKNNLFGKVRGN